jgi:hypothetical protein
MVRLSLLILAVGQIAAVELTAPALAQVNAGDAGARALPPSEPAHTQPPVDPPPAPASDPPSAPGAIVHYPQQAAPYPHVQQAAPMSPVGPGQYPPSWEQCTRFLFRAAQVPALQQSPDYQACRARYPSIGLNLDPGRMNAPPTDPGRINAPPMGR